MGEQRSGNADEVKFVGDMAIDVLRRPITVEEYNRMGEAEIFASDERIELLDGELIVSPRQGPAHASTVMRLQHMIAKRLGERALVPSQSPVIVSALSEPEPDVAVLAWRDDFYASGIPRTNAIFALIEVSYTTLALDRGKKLAIYARAGVREYWIADVRSHCLEIHRDPRDDVYGSLRTARGGELVAFAAFPDVTFTVDELLG